MCSTASEDTNGSSRFLRDLDRSCCHTLQSHPLQYASKIILRVALVREGPRYVSKCIGGVHDFGVHCIADEEFSLQDVVQWGQKPSSPESISPHTRTSLLSISKRDRKDHILFQWTSLESEHKACEVLLEGEPWAEEPLLTKKPCTSTSGSVATVPEYSLAIELAGRRQSVNSVSTEERSVKDLPDLMNTVRSTKEAPRDAMCRVIDLARRLDELELDIFAPFLAEGPTGRNLMHTRTAQ
ncbi:hypothetical protein FA10DRAFT_277635 [Acaromyces ingoldii]|uniref:Uncharacterized protein n=1 Tax=Acaromyces ingoldii TaxID=215250 RepID=A0A316Z1A6_9BASI|nr:hypothetical protein FA10DRAFT_277635 [Acaromyces ingoldii]PWN93953.1 hypothetical protein FA10DRAFT_277635 [Acaromyces ingoldii]